MHGIQGVYRVSYIKLEPLGSRKLLEKRLDSFQTWYCKIEEISYFEYLVSHALAFIIKLPFRI